ncbi:phage baseplate assembly protein V [Salmonella enterica]|uniref:Phage baseplate assembly protein V n=1 Tax=Salmonella enterica TaxID=28901 RepID=A0A5U0H5V8_SALER|nr:phage baseplate assembly protein V [Salmonella enterica]EAN3292228.1 phage baseplate assembly protein V [Salmonella enterica subsp. enterica serovar Oranienburg]EAR0437059.1 phage baseplate assembly protein V [Salmonella enterica subsp. enterica serovar Poona]ECC9951936.1 phage baseplate assembly protein V [Salmonella enterica subsp. enterica]ECE0876156.1 phage baseplate assembly protein V [Salmonella enterica subsp. enterica serovar Abaetetuba]EDR7291864.1 phage baseplate assembly protein 
MASVDVLFSRLLAPLKRSMHLLLTRGVLTGVNDSLRAQNVQMTALDDETFDDVERLQQYGQISVPLAGAEIVAGCISGIRDHAVALIIEDRRYRPTGLESGDTGLYHFEGHRLRLTKDGRAILTCKTLEIYADERVLVDTPKTTFTGDVEIQKNLTVKGNSLVEGGQIVNGTSQSKGTFTAPEAVINGVHYSGHTHHENGRGSNTGGPQ